jgi:hypothetical protein
MLLFANERCNVRKDESRLSGSACAPDAALQQADRRSVGLLRSQNRPVSLQFDASTPADVASKIGLMQAMEPSSFSETLRTLTGERSFGLNLTQYGPPALLSDTSATAMALLNASLNTVHTRCAPRFRFYPNCIQEWHLLAATRSVPSILWLQRLFLKGRPKRSPGRYAMRCSPRIGNAIVDGPF